MNKSLLNKEKIFETIKTKMVILLSLGIILISIIFILLAFYKYNTGVSNTILITLGATGIFAGIVSLAIEVFLTDIFSESIKENFKSEIGTFKNDIKKMDNILDEIIDIKKLIIEPNYKVYGYQSDANKDLIKYIEDKKPQNIKMIEYSSKHVNDLISTLIRSGTNPKIYLLIQHPNEAESIKGQKERIINHLRTVLYHEREFRNFDNLKILFYKQRASLRGRNFDNKLINIGWYIYELDEGDMRVNGHKKPSFILKENNEGFSNIQKMFNDNFDNLWTNGISLKEAINECYKNSNYDDEFIEWCEKVSPKIGDRKIEV
jgi:uncharacterized membrane protein (DUF485 family)